MTNEEAKAFLDNLKICIEEHPIVADWLAEIADRKTENNSEKPNNCECEPRKEQNFCGKCRYLYRDFKYGLSCYRLMDNEPCKYEERKDEPTISKMEQVEDETQVVMPKKCKGCDSASKIIEAYSKGFEDGAEAVKAMPQTDCNECKFVGTYDTEFPCANCSRKTKDYYAKDEPQTDCAWREPK